MLKEKEKVLLRHLRENSRKSLAKISSETDIPVSTLFDSLKKMESSIIVKHCSILDFTKMGFGFRSNMVIKSRKKKELRAWLLQHPNINLFYSLIDFYDFFVQCIFRDLKELTKFREELENFEIESLKEHLITEELKKEGFQL
ncbi:hypothetical protein GF361_02335 [Candidatus Woesearchaeota archaeon]|nr:hypothetical protein [Candidatus Woesearchaeota archaeon]